MKILTQPNYIKPGANVNEISLSCSSNSLLSLIQRLNLLHTTDYTHEWPYKQPANKCPTLSLLRILNWCDLHSYFHRVVLYFIVTYILAYVVQCNFCMRSWHNLLQQHHQLYLCQIHIEWNKKSLKCIQKNFHHLGACNL